MDNPLKTQAFKLKGRLYTFTVLQLLNSERDFFEQELTQVIAKAPRLFENTPVVLDLTQLQENGLDANFDLAWFSNCLRKRGLIPIAIQSNAPELSKLAQKEKLAYLNASSAQDKAFPLTEEVESSFSENLDEPETLSPCTDVGKSKIQTAPVRSGQQVVSKGGDLVITASVSAGAELLAEGNIHIYGTLRGRALAGISGNREARIFCQALEAELVSIAGFYRLSDAIEPLAGPCQIYLKDNHIQIEPLC
ncbi:MAG: septum site-determining protein MinC [Legionella sp.]|nr:septum site-determining protein MinC [Legionella sp.]